jgi:hypothetical protein
MAGQGLAAQPGLAGLRNQTRPDSFDELERRGGARRSMLPGHAIPFPLFWL